MEDDTFAPDEGLDAAFSGLLETGNEKCCLVPILVVDSHFGASGFASVGLLRGEGGTALEITSATDGEENNTGAKAEPDGVPIALFSSATANFSSERLESFSPSQKGFSTSLRGWIGGDSVGVGSIGVGNAVKFNAGEKIGGAGVFVRN